MAAIDLQSDDFMILLTDALRAGPGSPEWLRAVQVLTEAGAQGDEYTMLITAREHLESGRPYRAVRPGPNFTRKVMDQVEQAQMARGRVGSPAGWIAAAAALLVIATVGLVIYFAVPGGGDDSGLADLERTYFVQPRVEIDFAQPLDDAWIPIGQLAVQPGPGGLRLADATAPADAYLGGGVMRQASLPAEQAFAVEARLRAERWTDDLIPQVFITDTPQFTPDRGTSSGELAWLIQAGAPAVALPDGRLAGQSPTQPPDARNGMTIRVLVSRDHAIVESGGERVFAGPHQLSPQRPRYVGVRFLKRGDADPAPVRFESLRILHPQETGAR